MSLIDATSFEDSGSIPSSNYLPQNMVGTGSGLTGTTLHGAKSGTRSLEGNGWYVWKAADRTATMQILVWVNRYTNGVASDLLSLFGDGTTTEHIVLRYDTTGKLLLDRGASNVATESGTSLTEDVFVHIEMIASLDDSSGNVKVYVDSNPTPVIDFTGDTKNAGTEALFSSLRFSEAPSAGHVYDDLAIINNVGSAPLNCSQQLKACLVESITLSSDGSSSSWTTSTGSTHNTLIDDTGFATLTDYIEATAPGVVDLFVTADLSNAAGTVYAVDIHLATAKIGGGSVGIKPVFRVGGIDYDGPDEVQTVIGEAGLDPVKSWLSHFVVPNNPATGIAWTINQVNNSEFGVKAT